MITVYQSFFAGVIVTLIFNQIYYIYHFENCSLFSKRNLPLNPLHPKLGIQSFVETDDNKHNRLYIKQGHVNRTHSCEETYDVKHNRFYIKSGCIETPINKTTTLILTHLVYDNITSVITSALPNFYEVILVGSNEKIEMIKEHNFNSKNLKLISKESKKNYGEAVNQAVDMVKSFYVLIAPKVIFLEFETPGQKLDVHRLIRTMESTKGDVVGGATKYANSGYWNRGCYQSSLLMYTLKYVYGYQNSIYECLVCDYLISPFLSRKDFLQKNKFFNGNNGLFQDFFLRLRFLNRTVLSCPDVMFYVEPFNESNTELTEFCERWDIGQIIEADNTKKEILLFRSGPNDSKSIDFEKCNRRGSLALHPGCRSNLRKFIFFVVKTFNDNGFRYAVDDGTLLGVLKFQNILPWEYDADLVYILSEHEKIIKTLAPIWQKNGIRVEDRGRANQNINLFSQGWMVELWGYKSFQLKQTATDTLVKLGNKWLTTNENPGFFMRNRYGLELYRHAEHWRALGKPNSWDLYDAGNFKKCVFPRDQKCLDNFQADGDIQFAEYL